MDRRLECIDTHTYTHLSAQCSQGLRGAKQVKPSPGLTQHDAGLCHTQQQQLNKDHA